MAKIIHFMIYIFPQLKRKIHTKITKCIYSIATLYVSLSLPQLQTLLFENPNNCVETFIPQQYNILIE